MIPQLTKSKKQTKSLKSIWFLYLISFRRTKKGRVDPVQQERKPVVLHLAQVGSVFKT